MARKDVSERLPRYVSADYVEEFNQRLSQEPVERITIDITAFSGCRLFGDGLLLGCLVGAKRRGVSINIRVPSSLSRFDPASSKYWRVFLRTIPGVVFAQLADNIIGPQSRDYTSVVRERQAEVLNAGKGLIGSGESVAAPISDQFGRPAASAFITDKDVRSFARHLRGFIKSNLGLPVPNEISSISDFVFELLQNTRDHGCTDIKEKAVGGVRFVSVRRINLDQFPIQRLINASPNPVSSYLDLLEPDLRASYTSVSQLVEVTIADSGIGIAARMARSTNIYSEGINRERSLLLKALEPTGTSKPPSVAGAGLGLYKVMNATNRLRGLVLFRSGRLCMSKHYLTDEKRWPSLDLQEWGAGPCSLVAGTSVSLLFPWIVPGQVPLAFD